MAKDSKEKDIEAAPAAKTGLTTKHVALILGLTLILAAAAIVAVLLLRTKEQEAQVNPGVDISLANIESIVADANERVERGMFRTHMNTTWSFRDGKSQSHDAVMGNSASNNFDFYFTVTLQTGELVFTSGLIPLGSQIKDIVLDEELPAGTYPAVVHIQMIGDDGVPIEANSMGLNITLVIES